jgi:hypothetical protein
MIERAILWNQPLHCVRLQAYKTVRNVHPWPCSPYSKIVTRVWNCHGLRSRPCQAIRSDENWPTTRLAAMFSEANSGSSSWCVREEQRLVTGRSPYIYYRLVERALKPAASTHSASAPSGGLFLVLALSKLYCIEWCTNWNGFGRKRSWLNPCTISSFGLRDRGKSRKAVRIASVSAEVRIELLRIQV